MKRALIVLVLATTAAVYAAMLLWSLPALTAIAATGGLADARMFDMRPGGYDFDSAKALLVALGGAGRAQYLSVQHKLDTIFPPLNGLSMFIGLTFVAARLGLGGRIATAVAALLALAVAGFDLAENAAVAGLLRAGPEAITPEMAQGASRLSVLKSTSVTVTLTVLLAGLAAVGFRGWRGMRKRDES